MKNTIKNIIEKIDLSNNFIITTHVNPDGDAIGSELALARYLQSLGKNVTIINHSPTPDYLFFMLNSKDNVLEFKEELHSDLIKNADVIFTLDMSQLSRTKSLENFIRKSTATKICIDHHPSPEDYAELSLVETTSSSTGELVYYLIKQAEVEITLDIALPLYVAIMTDTGSFKYERTTANLHRIIAELLDAGVVPISVHQEIYDQGSANRIQLLGRAFNSLVIAGDGKLAYMKISLNDLKETNSKEEDVEGFVSYTLSIKGVEVGLFFFELENGFKISLRSSTTVPVNKLAGEFNGGGHFFAAGARLEDKSMKDTIPKIIETANQYIKQYSK
ncbi:MAG: bifunctional oligoribonuclease/PAP phosphatase NrnA [Melioribacteraceae bacterium]|jgi:phosphoesterase RecJ-like protein|nr:bifunctional oligoribonuclease/PAP phosphatase NrnA [Melioribacteraceae bacterium]